MEVFTAIQNYMESLNIVSTIVRLVFAAACGALMGVERRKSKQPVGMRTYMLLAIGAATVSITSQYMWDYFAADRPDAQRLGAQVVSGTGFLCASVIIGTKKKTVRGITTAAEMWACACLGLAIGIGNYWVGLVGTALVFFVMTISRKLESAFLIRNTFIPLTIQANNEEVFYKLSKELHEKGVRVAKVSIDREGSDTTNDDEHDDESNLSTLSCGIEDPVITGQIFVKSKKVSRSEVLRITKKYKTSKDIEEFWL